MLYSLATLRRCPVRAEDGDIGSVHDLFFDDVSTLIRYLVVDTGGGLDGRRMLIVPDALGQVRPDEQVLPTNLSRATVEASPDVATDLPVARQEEQRLHKHFAWDPYWTMLPPAAGGAVPFWGWMARPEPGEPTAASAGDPEVSASVRPRGDPHLRSAREVTGYHVEAQDGEVGKVNELIVDDASWAIAYLVIDTGDWLQSRPVLVAPEWMRSVDWASRRVEVELSREQIENSPPYDPSAPLDIEHQQQLAAHYGRPFGARAGAW
jgi:hypothetical protein